MPTCPSCGRDVPGEFPFCPFCGAPLREAGAASLREERKVVSVLFCDLVGFTSASDAADPEDVRSRIRPYHARLRQEIERHGGTVEKFVGDAVMAVFGAPLAHEDDPERAVRSGLAILEAIAELNEADPALALQVRVGINTGEAVVVLDARPEHGEGIVTGDVVNTAARIQTAAPVDGVAVAEATYRATSRVFDYEPLEPVSVKGKAAPLPLWRPTASRAAPGRDAGHGYTTPLVGRELEKPLLVGIFERAAERRSVQLVTVVGEPGVGKSRLCAELLAYVRERRAGTRWLQGRALPYGEATMFSAFGEIVKTHAGILGSDSAESTIAKLEEALPGDAPERPWVLERLRPLVGVGSVSSAEREELFAAWRRFVEGLAAPAPDPTVLVFEDLHWADESLLAFVEYLVEWSHGVPLLVLCTTRPELYERRPGWGAGQQDAHAINLSPLSEHETAALVSHLVSGERLDPAVERMVVERSEGNPLYAEEFARLLVDRDATLDAAALPETVQALIAARLDTLSPERKSLLQDASVFGKVFWAGGVAEVGGHDPAEVVVALHDLARKELIRPVHVTSMEGEDEYAFWHVLVREVAYAQIPRAERARRHRAVAAWVERKAGERVAELAEVLAHHYLEALSLAEATGDTTDRRALELQAQRFLALAGERALQLDVEKAEAHYGRALELLPADAPGRPAVLAKSAEAAALAGRYAEAEERYAEAIAALEASDESLLAGEALVRLSIVVRDRGDPERARSLLDRAVELLERVPPGVELIFAYTHLARYYHFTWPPEECFAWADKAIATAAGLGRDDWAMRARVFRGFTRFETGDAGGLDELLEALRLGVELGLGEDTAGAYLALGDVVWWSEGPAAGLEVYRDGVSFTERRAMAYYTRYLQGESVWPLFDLGRWDEVLRTAAEIVDWNRTSYQALLALPYVAHVHLFRGDANRAAELCVELDERARRSGDPQVLMPTLAVSAFVHSTFGAHDRAVAAIADIERRTRDRPVRRGQHLADAVRVCAAAGALDLAERLLDTEVTAARQRHSRQAARAVLLEARGSLEDALREYEGVAGKWAEYGFALERGQALLGAGRCLVALGEGRTAAGPLRAAREVFATLGAKPLLAETDALLAGVGPSPPPEVTRPGGTR